MRNGFTLLEVMVSLAIVAGLLVTALYTLQYHLGVAGRQVVVTTAANLAKEKMVEMEASPQNAQGRFPDPYGDYAFQTAVTEGFMPGIRELRVEVTHGRERIAFRELVRGGNQ